jgi:hypothetical protein
MAGPFYACSHSFVRFLAARFGAPRIVALLDAPDAEAALAALGGGTAAELRGAWVATLPATPAPNK